MYEVLTQHIFSVNETNNYMCISEEINLLHLNTSAFEALLHLDIDHSNKSNFNTYLNIWWNWRLGNLVQLFEEISPFKNPNLVLYLTIMIQHTFIEISVRCVNKNIYDGKGIYLPPPPPPPPKKKK